MFLNKDVNGDIAMCEEKVYGVENSRKEFEIEVKDSKLE